MLYYQNHPLFVNKEVVKKIQGKLYGLFFTESIGYRINPENGSSTLLFYGEVKLDAENRYPVIPRTRPSQE